MTVFVIFYFVCATLQGLLVRALLLELLGMYTRSVLGNCLRINCVINFDQNTAGQNIDILFFSFMCNLAGYTYKINQEGF